MSSDRTKAILGALSDKCTCVYVDNENGDPELLMYHCAQCHAAEWIEALEGEVDELKNWKQDFEPELAKAEARAERLRVAGQKILAKLDHPTAIVTQWDADELRKALEDKQ
jgi:hypothetical protein